MLHCFIAMAETDDIYKTEQDAAAENGPPTDGQEMLELPGSTLDDRPKKRRRVIKPNPDKKFECKHEGCGKSYSRAEHLYRHQLNRKSCFSLRHCSRLTSFNRHPKDHLSLRLSRLPQVFCSARLVHSPQRASYNSWISAPQARYLYSVHHRPTRANTASHGPRWHLSDGCPEYEKPSTRRTEPLRRARQLSQRRTIQATCSNNWPHNLTDCRVRRASLPTSNSTRRDGYTGTFLTSDK